MSDIDWNAALERLENLFQESKINNEGTDDDPYIESTPDNMIKYLESKYIGRQG